MITKDKVLLSLRGVREPKFQKDFTQMNLVDVKVNENKVSLKIYLREDVFDQKDEIEKKVRNKINLAFGDQVADLQVEFIKVPDYSDVRKRIKLEVLDESKAKLGRVIAITSGKGGVGKSTVSINLAVALRDLGYRIGLLDADIYGPSIPTAFGLEGHILEIKDEKIQPIEKMGLKMVSIGFMIPEVDTPLIWRGPMLHKAINEMVNEVEWGDLDYLVVDLPPGTGDAILSLNNSVKIDGAIVVSTAQKVAAADVMKNINMLRTLSIPIIGIIQNMSYVECPCGERIYLWGKDGVIQLANKYEIEFLGEIPFIPSVVESMETGNFITLSEQAKIVFREISEKIINRLDVIAGLKRGG
ncbi:MAG: Mrp/NBP35 family ATP-binding protein [Candidatus Calescibacterium sp.]|nr:Mrp/NBP35 family ATP-binding protein [Candidatus Calescibacterium sp.]MCX7971925.1 Mrp/NBP35 family ATP-binding protein [bacterium]MDW8194976.1 Mrp/NBP35 family ATP-binding protein [Candidatus Calescibacterium sp.]